LLDAENFDTRRETRPPVKWEYEGGGDVKPESGGVTIFSDRGVKPFRVNELEGVFCTR
jgi:hypothetical protein